MKNLLAEVRVPGLELTMDLIIPLNITVRQAARLIADIVYNKEGVTLDREKLMLFDYETRALLDGNVRFAEAGVPDACSLVLI